MNEARIETKNEHARPAEAIPRETEWKPETREERAKRREREQKKIGYGR